jgi:hypothetical protein
MTQTARNRMTEFVSCASSPPSTDHRSPTSKLTDATMFRRPSLWPALASASYGGDAVLRRPSFKLTPTHVVAC